MKPIKVEIQDDFEVIIRGNFYPGYPAPNCQDHDDPRFGDPGADDEIDDISISLIFFNNGEKSEIEIPLTEQQIDQILDIDHVAESIDENLRQAGNDILDCRKTDYEEQSRRDREAR